MIQAAKTIKPLVDELEYAFGSRSPEKRADIMRGVTDLFLTVPTQLSAEQVAVFDDIINKLIGRLETCVLAELSQRLASSSNGPPQAVRQLASHESMDVAGPVLAHSNCLTDDHLIAIAESKSQPHLGKIAERVELSSEVTDVLVDRGDQDVVRKVAANTGARFSSLGMSCMAMRAEGDDELIEAISRRTDVPSLIFTQLLSYATDQTRNRLLATRPHNAHLVSQVLGEVSADAARLAATAKDWPAAQRLVNVFGQDTDLTRTKVLEFADGNQVTELIAALSVLSGVPVHLVGRLICDQNGFGPMVMCRAISLDWSIAHAVLSAGPNARAHRANLEDLCKNFNRLSTSMARRLLNFWQGRMNTRALFNSSEFRR